MEGAKTLQVPPGFLQPQVFGNEVHQVKPVLDLLDCILFHLRHLGKLTVPAKALDLLLSWTQAGHAVGAEG